MPDGIKSGIGEQLGNLGKQIATEVINIPAKITGMDGGTTNETAGSGTGGKQKGQKGTHSAQSGTNIFGLPRTPEQIAAEDALEKQKKLAEARRLLQQFIQPQGQSEPTLAEKQEMEEMEKNKKEIEEEKKKAKSVLPVVASKRPRGDLYGAKAKKFGGELGKNVKSQ